MARKGKQSKQSSCVEWNGLTFHSEEERLQFVAQDKLWRFLDGLENFKDDHDPRQLGFRTELFAESADYVARKIKQYLEHETTSMDEAFELRRPKGYRRASAREEHLKMHAVQRTGLKIRNAGAVTDEAFFEVLGQIHNLKRTKAKELYYRYGNNVDLPPRPRVGVSMLPHEYEVFADQLMWKDGYFPVFSKKPGNTT